MGPTLGVMIVRNDKVSIWNPSSHLHYDEELAKSLCTVTNKARPDRTFEIDSADNDIYTFAPQTRLGGGGNKFCQSFVILKLRDLVENGFPGVMELYDYSDRDAFAEKHFTFSLPPPAVREFYQHDFYAGMNIDKWMPQEIARIAALPNKHFEVMQKAEEEEINIVAVTEPPKLSTRLTRMTF